ncbi:cytochrome P450 [Actinomadura fulvescens]|uniref:Cytochrome P450 n=1 Tax=Actinomadura fulvescens TaxID=46160 RepID=A0ABP6CUR3_9ACTN
MPQAVPRTTMLESLKFSGLYTLPALLRGGFVLNPTATRLTERLDTNARAGRLCMRLRVRYGGRSVWVKGPTGKVLLVLSQGDIKKALSASDSVLSLCTKEKQRGLSVFQPDSLILSSGELREDRHRFHEAVLEPGRLPHSLAPRLREVMAQELDGLLGHRQCELDRDRLLRGYHRAVLRFVFGDAARDDTRIMEALRALRREANWMGLRRWRASQIKAHRQTMDGAIQRYVDAADADSLVGRFTSAPHTDATRPAGQVSHWLMALDGIGSALLLPALAVLAGHPDQCERARREAVQGGGGFLDACLLETARLWPLVPTLARTLTEPLDWHGTRLPAGTDVMIPLAVHHRNPQLDYADAFTPEAWLDGRAQQDWWIAPFSRGPGQCPGSDLGLQAGTAALAEILRQYALSPVCPFLGPHRPLPRTLDPLSLRLRIRPLGSRDDADD